jgi:hypothetical protein
MDLKIVDGDLLEQEVEVIVNACKSAKPSPSRFSINYREAHESSRICTNLLKSA